MQRFTVGLPLAPLAVGDEVDRAAWPPHVTLIGDHAAADGAVDVLAAIVRRIAAGLEPITAVVGEEAWFGPAGDVLVDLVASPALRAAHDLLLDAMEAEVPGFALDLPHRARSGCHPHRTVTAAPRPARGTALHLREVVLSELEAAGRPGRAVVVARAGLGAPAPDDVVVDAAAVHRVLDGLDSAGVRAWVVGGWGVDALAGRTTRQHHDLDLLVGAGGVPAAITALADRGFVVGSTWSENRWTRQDGLLVPSAFVAVDADGREVDVHVVAVDGERPVPLSASSSTLPVGALDGVGAIGGRAVPCATVEAQLVMHTGYDLPERQRADVALLGSLASA